MKWIDRKLRGFIILRCNEQEQDQRDEKTIPINVVIGLSCVICEETSHADFSNFAGAVLMLMDQSHVISTIQTIIIVLQ
jgi:ABC-type glucose/galactose transport system permease subunit